MISATLMQAGAGPLFRPQRFVVIQALAWAEKAPVPPFSASDAAADEPWLKNLGDPGPNSITAGGGEQE